MYSPPKAKPFTYTVTRTNGGPDDADSISVTDILPTGLMLN